MPAALLPQPFKSQPCRRDRFLNRGRTDFKGNNPCFAIRRRVLVRNADELRSRHPALRESIGEIARAGEVVGNAAKDHDSTLSDLSAELILDMRPDDLIERRFRP